jgi:biotin carboxyl carrier protein
MKYIASTKNHRFEFDLSPGENGAEIYGSDPSAPTDLRALGEGRYLLRVNQQSRVVHITRKNDHYEVRLSGGQYRIRVEDEKQLRIKELVNHVQGKPKEQAIRAPIPGLVVKILVNDGQEIAAGDNLLILEAMKMENVIKAPFACKVSLIMVQERDTVQQNQELIRLAVLEIE